MLLALLLSAALQQAPLAAAPSMLPALRLVEIERELDLAPRGWPKGPTIGMAASMVGATVFGTLAPVLALAFPTGIGNATGVLVVSFVATLVTATISGISAIISLIVAAVEGANRTAHVRALMSERERLLR